MDSSSLVHGNSHSLDDPITTVISWGKHPKHLHKHYDTGRLGVRRVMDVGLKLLAHQHTSDFLIKQRRWS